MTNGNDSASPQIQTDLDINNPTWVGEVYSVGGLTKREYFAGLATQGLMAANGDFPAFTLEQFASRSVGMADALIAALNKHQEESPTNG